MALTDAVMSLFGRGPQGVVNNPSNTVPATPGVAAGQQAAAAANPSVPSSATPASTGNPPAIPAVGTGPASPVENYETLWQADPNPKPVPGLVPAFNLDHKGLMESATKVNFVAHIDKELVTKAMSGDAEAFLSVINQASQFGFANATAASGELVKQSLGSAERALGSTVLPAAFRSQAVSQALDAANPVFSDPSVAPMLGMLKQQLMQKYPTAAPEEIAKIATGYLGTVAGKIAGPGTGGSGQGNRGDGSGYGAREETDWTQFFNVA